MNNLNAEASILSAMLLGTMSVSKAVSLIDSDDFSNLDHKKIFNAMLDLYKKGEPVDLITVGNYKIDTDLLNEISDVVLSDAHLESHCQIVKDHSQRRQIDLLLKNKINKDTDPIDYVANLQSGLFKIIENKGKSYFTPQETVHISLVNLEKTEEEVNRIRTGIPILDRDILMKPGYLTVIGGQPSMGKSVLGHQIGFYNAWHYDKKIIFINMEMESDDIINRQASAMSGVPFEHFVRSWEMKQEEHQKVADAMSILEGMQYRLSCEKNLSAIDIKSKCQQMSYDMGGVDLIVVDFLQCMKGSIGLKKHEQTSENIKALKDLAGDMGCHIIVISSLRRKSEHMKDQKPFLSDFKESGDIEYSADIALGLYLDYQHEDVERGMASYRVLKQRNGYKGERQFRFVPENVYFEEWI